MHDILAEVLTTLQLHSAIYCQSTIRKRDWALQFEPLQGGIFHIVGAGSCEFVGATQQFTLSQGDLLVLPHGSSHFIGDTAHSARCATIQLHQQTTGCLMMSWGDAGPETTLICGTFQFDAHGQQTLLSLLPPVLYFDAATTRSNGLKALIDALVDEANANRQGKSTMLNRLADILFVQIIRAWLIDTHSRAQGWLAGLRDPRIAAALSAFHAEPARDWTVAQLAAQSHMSRSGFAAHFAERVGMAPMKYVLAWRMQIACRLLQQPRMSLIQIANLIGYESDIAFSKAFKREQGLSPAVYRRDCVASATAAAQTLPSTAFHAPGETL